MIGVFNKSLNRSSDFKKYYKQEHSYRMSRRSREEAIDRRERIEKIRDYQLVELTQKEFDKLPKAGDFIVEWLRNEAPIGFEFICRRADWIPDDLVVLGHLVKGKEAICEQYGSGLSVPEKFVNRYRVKIVEAVKS